MRTTSARLMPDILENKPTGLPKVDFGEQVCAASCSGEFSLRLRDLSKSYMVRSHTMSLD